MLGSPPPPPEVRIGERGAEGDDPGAKELGKVLVPLYADRSVDVGVEAGGEVVVALGERLALAAGVGMGVGVGVGDVELGESVGCGIGVGVGEDVGVAAVAFELLGFVLTGVGEAPGGLAVD